MSQTAQKTIERTGGGSGTAILYSCISCTIRPPLEYLLNITAVYAAVLSMMISSYCKTLLTIGFQSYTTDTDTDIALLHNSCDCKCFDPVPFPNALSNRTVIRFNLGDSNCTMRQGSC